MAENYSECYHCPGIHPQLNKLTPYDLGGDFAPTGPWQGGWMELVESAETMAVDGGHRGGRPAIPGMTPIDERRIYYYLVWPLTFLSIHPDYLLVHRLEPAGPDHTRIICEWLFEPETIAASDFDDFADSHPGHRPIRLHAARRLDRLRQISTGPADGSPPRPAACHQTGDTVP